MKKEESFDLIVIGAGSGLEISSQAAEAGWKVAVVEQGAFGGTCLNRGCIPSKMYIHVADVMRSIQDAGKLGIRAKATGVDWKAMVKRVTGMVDADAKEIEEGNKSAKNITVFKTTAKFVGHKRLQVGDRVITAANIVIAAGTRPSIPPIPGLDKVDFITSDEALRLPKQPKSMIFIGGGYIACELAHFFGTLGTKVTVVQRSGVLLGREDREVATKFTEVFSKRFDVRLNTATNRVFRKGKLLAVEIEKDGRKSVITAEQLLVATGRKPNTDLLDVAASGVALDKNGFVQTDGFMRASVPGIWAIGDIAGKWQFKHAANLEAEYCGHNILHPKDMVPIDYAAMPHAVFSSPQLASVGHTEEELIEAKRPYQKGVYAYKDTGYGAAMMEEDGFVKVLVYPGSREILGCHIIGPHASMLIHEVVVAMKAKLGADGITQAIHVHPALSEVVQRAFGSLD
jgi:dihydrolipoamide dehydrogenase